MGVELLIEPGRSALMDSDTQEIGSRTVGTRAVCFLMFAVAGATIEWPSPSHARLSFLPHQESKNVSSVSKSNRTRRGDRYCRPASPRRTVAVKSRIAPAILSQVHLARPRRPSTRAQKTEPHGPALCRSGKAFSGQRRHCNQPVLVRFASSDRRLGNGEYDGADRWDFFPNHQRNKCETCLDEHSASIARRFCSDVSVIALLGAGDSGPHLRYQSRQTN